MKHKHIYNVCIETDLELNLMTKEEYEDNVKDMVLNSLSYLDTPAFPDEEKVRISVEYYGERKFGIHNEVRKIKGSSWHGRVVGFYSTDQTPIGYAVESIYEKGSVQIYPENALEFWKRDAGQQ